MSTSSNIVLVAILLLAPSELIKAQESNELDVAIEQGQSPQVDRPSDEYIPYDRLTEACSLLRCKHGSSCRIVKGTPRCVCDTNCPKIYAPICASDHRTYPNLCYLQVARCNQKRELPIIRKGKCLPI